MTGAENKIGEQAKTEKGAGVKAEDEAEREVTGIVIPVVNTQAKAIAKAGSEAVAIVSKKAVSKNRFVAEMKERALLEHEALPKAMCRSWVRSKEINTGFSLRAENEATMVSGICSVTEAGAQSRSTCKDEAGIDSWFWSGEEASIGSWFWNGEVAGNRHSAKYEDEIGTGASSCEVGLGVEPAARVSCKPRPRAEEEEDIIGNWFWDGDDTSFDPNPRPVSRIIRPQPVDEINEKNRPKSWSEVTIWPNAPAVTPAVLGFRSQVPFETRLPSYVVLASAKESTHYMPSASVRPSRNASSYTHSMPENPFGSDPCIQTIEEIRRQIRIRELNGIKPFACPCKMECCMDSEEFEKLVSLLKSTTDPLIHKIAQIAMGINNIHPFAQEFINEVGVVTLIESLLSLPSPEMKKRVVITLNSPSRDERQHKVELHVKHMCKETLLFPLNSPGQQSGLKTLGQLTTDSDHHYIVANYFSELFHLLSQGNCKTRNLVLKVLLNMSENPVAARDMINIKSLSVLKLIFNQREEKANLVSAMAILTNIKEHIRKRSNVVVDHLTYNTLMAIFREVKMIIETM
ncbi:G protein-coupled receptor associated sorting protein 3 [Dasypus novemcinctus]|uniref:G protein-coupled receptor associated sorting protein 3 n=1 Tax=Dasypus novemcinctus TaxID=9361 RepID=UPI000328BDFC|nr:G protein-coupled receptor associated sorting protein 3 [Dasypus novemcinctus]XP_012385131.1 G protein-coupled receptor associated sorting protein 3 [Dasypus novemcinctus]XP_058147266.1 G protein-coupled receptor associated sorting protein 3 [Dasypus novemcinctus]XP_058147267.1 G protein-coupled receptor associated sorting protein 3 [Dasypus novemcinctus]XP_058147268.1 G protein-coupled receptor associated sorting protein 3 [Dasypus novemcinctus]